MDREKITEAFLYYRGLSSGWSGAPGAAAILTALELLDIRETLQILAENSINAANLQD